MRLLKNIIIGLFVLCSLVFIISLLFPSTVTVSRDISINSNPGIVKRELLNVLTWPEWYVSFKANPKQVSALPFENGDGGSLTWKVGENKSNKITLAVVDSASIDADVNTNGDLTMQSRFSIAPSQDGRSARLLWKVLLPLGWQPWHKFRGMFAEDMIAPMMEETLNNFKAYVESKNDTLR